MPVEPSPRSWPSPARVFAWGSAGVLVSLALLGATPTRAPAVPPAAASTTDLVPSARQGRVARLVGDLMERQHFRHAALDDQLSALVFESYLEALDGNRSYLLASDIAEFESYRNRLDDAIRDGDVEPAFVIFARLQERNRELMRYAIELLETQPDFTLDESYQFERNHEPWPATMQEMHDIWRRRVKNDALSLMLAGKTWPEAREVLKTRYQRFVKRIDQVTSDDVFEIFMNACSHVFDPHSNYLSPRDSEEYNIAMSLSYEGIGASLQLVDDYVTVMNIIPGGAAARSGQLKANDRITAVGQGKSGPLTDVVGWRLDDVVQLIRGPEGTTVRLQVLPAGATPGTTETQLSFARSKVTLEAQAARKDVRRIERDGRALTIGVITVPSFYQDFQARVAGEDDYRSTTRDVRRLIGELRQSHVDAIVMDLRNNGGGHLSEATGLVGLFVDRGPVVQLRETSGRTEVLDDPEPGVAWDGPLVVLVNRASASASEIFAGAIQDYGRGIIVGQQTYGKGSVQNLYPLDRYALGPRAGYGQLTLTIGKYYRVTGDSTQHRGVTPDIPLPSLIDVKSVGESTQDHALPWDRIRSTQFSGSGALPVDRLALLTRRHQGRLTGDPDLKAVAEEVAEANRLSEQSTVSLNLETRKRERAEREAFRLATENHRRAARGLAQLATIAELEAAEEPDALLQEAAEIAADASAPRSVEAKPVEVAANGNASPGT
ncbi:MAG: carboxy terminal-processing peptidase [Steroidobacteraceae bacterium]